MRIKRLFESGYLIEEEAAKEIESLSEDEFKEFSEYLKKEKPDLITKEMVLKYKKISVFDLSRKILNYFNFFKKILQERIPAVSISSCKEGKVYIIGMVMKKNKYLEVEDPTGCIKVFLKNREVKIIEDDVLGFYGSVNSGFLFAEKVFFPDIPIKDVKLSEKPEILKLGEKDINYKFLDKNGIKILIFRNETEFTPVELLKRRVLEPGNVFTDKFLEEVPDIMISTGKEEVVNYKGTTVVTFERGSVEIELHTRRVRFI